MRIYFATSNVGKFAEAKAIIGKSLVQKAIDLDEIQDMDVNKVIIHKIRQARESFDGPLVVDDTGLYIEALNGFPGALVKPMLLTVGKEGICRLLDRYGSRRAQARTAVAYLEGKHLKVFSSSVNGTIVDRPRGKHRRKGFGFEFIFMPDGSRKVFAEMNIEEKGRFAARAKSFMKLRDYLLEEKALI